MANVAHASLTGTELHEPKGADTAALGTVYVANGAGSGSWSSIGTSAFTGMIADFPAVVAPTGWLECDGSLISTSTYSGLFAVMSVTTSGTRTNGSPIITSIASTTSYKVGYYVFGTGINTGTTILSIDSPSQITLSANASSSGTSSFFVSPFLMDTGTIKLPDLTTAGRFRRSRSSSTKVGDLQADQNKAHTHTASSDTVANHTHANSLTDPGHIHGTTPSSANMSILNTIIPGVNTFGSGSYTPAGLTVNSATTGITITNAAAGSHSHAITVNSDGSAEARPLGFVVLTCIKT